MSKPLGLVSTVFLNQVPMGLSNFNSLSSLHVFSTQIKSAFRLAVSWMCPQLPISEFLFVPGYNMFTEHVLKIVKWIRSWFRMIMLVLVCGLGNQFIGSQTAHLWNKGGWHMAAKVTCRSNLDKPCSLTILAVTAAWYSSSSPFYLPNAMGHIPFPSWCSLQWFQLTVTLYESFGTAFYQYHGTSQNISFE
jgi:hypothetical protein